MVSSPWTVWSVWTQVGDAGSLCPHFVVQGSAPPPRCWAAWPTSWAARAAAGCWTRRSAWTSRRACGSPCPRCTPGATGPRRPPRTGECTLLVAVMALGRLGCAAWSDSIRRRGLGASSHHCRFRVGVQLRCLLVAAYVFLVGGTAMVRLQQWSDSTLLLARGSRCLPCRRRGSSAVRRLAGAEPGRSRPFFLAHGRGERDALCLQTCSIVGAKRCHAPRT
mmetsp:Transcript_79202/g.232549  ORF Transcript_79202/g.232549 Transcript_79202/m.232549 type:complete len:221 (+) Transcript_79202:833-1495(+)